MRERIKRLELATRFRPLHIAVLVVNAAPAAPAADFFYAGEKIEGRSDSALKNDAALYSLAGTTNENTGNGSRPLAEFQRAGFFVTSVAECALVEQLDARRVAGELVGTFVLRVRHSYKPRYIFPISDAVSGMLPLLGEAGYGEQILLGTNGQIFDLSREKAESIRFMANRISVLLAGKNG